MDAYGFAMCCGKSPELGYFDPVVKGAPMARCPVCKRSQGVIGGFEDVRRYWNVQFWQGVRKPETWPASELLLADMQAGWRPCEFRIDLATFGRTDKHYAEGAFLADRSLRELLQKDTRDGHLTHVTLELWPSRRRLTLNWPWKKRCPSSTVYAAVSHHFDQALTLNIYATLMRQHCDLMAWLNGAGEEKE